MAMHGHMKLCKHFYHSIPSLIFWYPSPCPFSHTSCPLYPSLSMLTTHIFIFSNHLTNPFLTLVPSLPIIHSTHEQDYQPIFLTFSHYPWLYSTPIPLCMAILISLTPPTHHTHFLLLLIFGSFPTYIKSHAHNQPQGSPHHHPPMPYLLPDFLVTILIFLFAWHAWYFPAWKKWEYWLDDSGFSSCSSWWRVSRIRYLN